MLHNPAYTNTVLYTDKQGQKKNTSALDCGVNGYVSEEQSGFLEKGRGMCGPDFKFDDGSWKKCYQKGKTLYAAFIDVENSFDTIKWEAIWHVLRVAGVVGKLVNGVKSKRRCCSKWRRGRKLQDTKVCTSNVFVAVQYIYGLTCKRTEMNATEWLNDCKGW